MSTIERLAELAKGATPGPWVHEGGRIEAPESPNAWVVHENGRVWKNDCDFIAACNPAVIAQAATEYAAVVAERDALREALTGMVAQHGCDCGHPHCNRCAETRECKAALAQGEVGNDN
jgi:hypothetical protein